MLVNADSRKSLQSVVAGKHYLLAEAVVGEDSVVGIGVAVIPREFAAAGGPGASYGLEGVKVVEN